MSSKTVKIWALITIGVCFSGLTRADVFNMDSGLTSLEMVPVGNFNNAPDPSTGFGSVGYAYGIGKYEVTAGQYAVFLNAVASTTDPYGLYNVAMATTAEGSKIIKNGGVYTATLPNQPVNWISWGDAARFCNWLQNGQKTYSEDPLTTEIGSYTLGGYTDDTHLMAVTRNPGCQYAITTENEWYKAAYYDPNKSGPGVGGYWLYPTKNDTAPTAGAPPGGSNSANYNSVIGNASNVGAYINSSSPYGTFDQGGNLRERNETVVSSSTRGLRGGAFWSNESYLSSFFREACNPSGEAGDWTFRIAIILDLSNPWKGPGGGSYHLAANWSEGIVPNGVDATANFLGNITALSQITLDSNATLGTINFNSANRYILRGTSSLILQTNSGQANINAQSGFHNINVPVVLNSDTLISGAGTLILNGGVSGGHTLTLQSHVTTSSIRVNKLNAQAFLTATSIQVDSLNIGNVGASQAVPEPSILAMLLSLAVGGLLWWKRR